MVSRFEYHARESLMGKRRQRRKEQLRNRAVALAAGLLLVGVCGVSSALAVTEGSDGLDVTDVPQDAASLSAAPSSLVPAEDDALWQVAVEGGSDAALKEIASRGANLLAARSGDQGTVEGMQITTAVVRAEGGEQDLISSSSFSVDFNKQFTLHIEVESELNLANKKVEITVPDGLTVVEYPIPERGGMAESVTPESIDNLHSKNNYGGYCPTNGTITYSLKNTAEKNSFNIVLAPDTVLWNRSTEQELKNPLTIKTYTGDAGDTDSQIEYKKISATPKITGKYAPPPLPGKDPEDSGSRAIQTGPRLSRIGVKTGVPTAANQPFALRQIWINPDKDYIDMPQFFKKLEITIALPHYTKNGSNIYAELDHITWDPAGESTRPNLLDPKNHKGEDGSYKDGFTFTQKTNENDHTVTLTWENLYLEYAQDYFTPYFKWVSDCDVTDTNAVKWDSASILNTGKTAPGCYEGKTPTTGDASAVGGTITWQDDSTWYLYNGDCTTFSFTAREGESMSVAGKANDQPIYNYAGDSGITYYLGQFHVVNQGAAASANKTVEFTYANNDRIGVTAQKIPASTGNTVEVWYTTTTNSTEQKYNGTLTSSGGFVTFTAQMAGLGEDEYFTKIKANVGSYEKDYVGYVASRAQDPTSGYATTFGKLLTAEEATYSNFASMKMYDTGSGDSTAKSGDYTVKVTNTRGEIPLAMEQAYKEGTLERVPILSKTSTTAGETITFNGLLSSSAYPYSSNNVTTDQEIYIRLPEKITVENLKLYQEVGRIADKVFLLDAVVETVKSPQRTEIPKTAYKFEAVTSAEAGYKLYKITFTNQDNPAKVGWFTDGLGQYQIGISFDMNIAKDADAMTLDMRDCVRFKSASLTSTSNNGTLAQYQVMDNGVRYSTFNVNAKGTKLSVVAARLGLTFTFGARMTEKGSTAVFDATQYSNFENDGKKVYLKDANHVVDMLFTLKNETGRAFSKEDAQAFYYFIPVPKKGDLWDSHMQDTAFEFDMNLTRAPELQIGGNHQGEIQVTYATDIESKKVAGDEKHYTNTDQYQTEGQLLDGCTTDEEKAAKWKTVKMIRIAAKPDTTSIPQDAELKVNMRLEPMFEGNANLVGSEINFGPCGVSPYSVGNTLNQGHNPLPRIQVEFQTGVIAGKIFIDKDFNGTYDEGTDELYTGGVTVEANHSNGNENCAEGDAAHKATATGGTFSFNGRRADTYHVVVTNPGSTDANGNNPLKFSLPEIGGKFSLDAGKNTATASVVLDMNKNPNDIADAQNLMIGLQQPHTVTFSVPYGQGGTTTKVWHGDKLGNVIPTVTADKDYRFTGNWTDGTNTYTADQLKEVEISADVTFTAEVKQLYSLTYDLNGGSGAAAPATSTHIEGEKVRPDYTGTGNLKKGEDTIFVGWSEEQIPDPLQEDAAQADINKIISADEHTMPARNVTLYAVYAVDGNGNGNPDYNDDAVHVRYHGNNNVREDILCPHHHVAGATAKLSTSGTVSGKSLGHDKPASAASGEVTSHTFAFTDKTTGNAHIFIGWSTSPILDTVIKTKADYDGLASSIVTEVTMEKAKADGGNVDDDGNTNVYAVWAADRNGNKTADYLEEYTLAYDGNAQQGGTVSNVPTDSKIYIPGDEVPLSTAAPTHDDVDGKKVVFIGWTEAQTNAIFSRADTAPATVTEVTFGSTNKTVYAAWGYDEDGDNTADVLETYTLSYDLNGGGGEVPEAQKDIKKHTQVPISEKKDFTKDGCLFVGWSRAQREVFTAAQRNEAEQNLIHGKTVLFSPPKDIVLYAVWAQDRNENKTADYLEAQYKLIYNDNAQSGGSVSSLPSDNKIYLTDETVTLSDVRPTHSSADGKSVVFLGWTERRIKILSRSDDEPSLVNEVTFTDANKTVYAAWGYDENGDGVADVAETYTLSYDLNGGSVGGGTGSVPPDETGIKKGARVSLASGEGLTRQTAGPDGIAEVFAGWSRAKHEGAFTAEQRDEAEKALVSGEIIMGTEDLTLYAVWAQDRNNTGTPDFSETSYKIIYDGNAQGNGTVKGLPVDEGLHLAGDTVSLGSARPTHSGLNGKEVVFLGWTLDPINGIFDHEAVPASADEVMARDGVASPAYVESVKLDEADVTVYAAWGYQDHVWGEWVVETPSTCTQQGTEKRTCTTCDAVERRPLDVLPHEWEASFEVDKPVTCVEDGLKSNHCKHCGATRYATPIPSVGHVFGGWKADAAGHWRECTVCNIKAAAGAHEFREVMADDGRRHEVCSVCGYDREKQAILPVTGVAGGSGWFQTLVRLPQTGDPQDLWVVVLLATAILGASVSVVAFGHVRRLVRGRHAK